MKRRSFIKKVGLGSALIGVGAVPLKAFSRPEFTKLTILHTNDVHSHVDPFPMDGGKYQGLGGAVRRAAMIDKVRSEESHVLLLDAGDIFQGTPYFNKFGGELDMKLMSKMRYDAATIGNHDFDAGIDGLEKQLKHANFPILIANYDFSDTVMAEKTKSYKTFERGGIKIGVFGIGIELDGLVPNSLFLKTRYLDPIEIANRTAKFLKYQEKCDYIICLSHLGYQYKRTKVSDIALAKESEGIDLIIGGHTHTFMDKPDEIQNKIGEKVLINQVGWAGIMLGRLDVYFEKNYRGNCTTCDNITLK